MSMERLLVAALLGLWAWFAVCVWRRWTITPGIIDKVFAAFLIGLFLAVVSLLGAGLVTALLLKVIGVI